MASTNIDFEIVPEESFYEFQRGFLEGSNPRAYNRLLQLATLNAVRTMVKPMKDAAPKKTGRLAGSVTAKGGRYSKPSATVGPRPGKSRGDLKGGWYRYFVTSGHNVRGPAKPVTRGLSWADIGKKKQAPVVAVTTGTKRVPGRPFVAQVSSNEANLQKAMDSYYATIEKFFNDSVFRHGITKFKRKGK